MKGTVIIDLEELLAIKESENIVSLEYLDAKKEIVVLKEKNELLESQNKKLKKLIMETNIENYMVDNFYLNELLDETNWRFPFAESKDFLLDYGITIDEMKEYIKEVKDGNK